MASSNMQLSLFETQEKTGFDVSDIAAIGLPDYLKIEREKEAEPKLTVLSFGGGQDSFAILFKIIHDPEFRKKYAPNDLIVVMSDTGNEHPYTYKAVKEAEEICKANGIFFKLITSDMGFHTEEWKTLKTNLIKNSSILAAGMKSKPCTQNLKISVIDKFLYHYLCEKYDIPEKARMGNWHRIYFELLSKVRILIGFAKGEEKRVKGTLNNPKIPKWKKDYVQFAYPLVEEGIDRDDAQKIILSYHPYLVPPSNCMLCFYQSKHELLWLYRTYADEFNEWVEMEKNKLEKYKDRDVNYGVYGVKTLPERIEWIKNQIDKKWSGKKFDDLTNEELWEYKLSHGHCVKSSY